MGQITFDLVSSNGKNPCKGEGCLRKSHCLRFYSFLIHSWKGDLTEENKPNEFLCQERNEDFFENFDPSPFPVMQEKEGFEMRDPRTDPYFNAIIREVEIMTEKERGEHDKDE